MFTPEREQRVAEMSPYCDQNGFQILCGDCRRLLPQLVRVDLILSEERDHEIAAKRRWRFPRLWLYGGTGVRSFACASGSGVVFEVETVRISGRLWVVLKWSFPCHDLSRIRPSCGVVRTNIRATAVWRTDGFT